MEGRANEGGEWFLTSGHRQVHALSAAEHQGFRARRGSARDGFCATVVHLKGFSLVVIVFYGLSSVGLTGDNLVRYHKLGGLVRSLQLPWLIVGDFNVPAATLARTDFFSSLGGRLYTGDL
eukprot:4351193-Pyramimonas_sp.AAC.1